MLRPFSACVSAAALCALSQLASGQTLGWLPMADLPPTTSEVRGDPVAPMVSSIIEWDPDGTGPLTSRIVAHGALSATFSGGRYVAALTDSGWQGMNSDFTGTGDSPYSMVRYQSPVDSLPQIILGGGSGRIRRYDDGAWTVFANVTFPRTMCVGDLDGPSGPEPECLFIAGSQGVIKWNGMFTQNLGNPNCGGLLVWDADGDGPQPPQLYAGSISGTNSTLRVWTGSSWVTIATFNAGIYAVNTFDFDGDGPDLPDLIVGGDFSQVNGTINAGRIARLHNGVWMPIGNGNATGVHLYRTTSFDPDGDGPMQPWLVVGGSFSSIGDVAASKLAAYYDNQWHAFPPYIVGDVFALSVAYNLPYSNSPQLLVGGFVSRPSVGRFGLCDGPAGITGNAPTRSRQPEGQSATFDVIPSGDELTFRWYKGDTALVDGATAHGSTISGVYSPRLTITNVRPQDIGQYHAVVFNPLGQARSRDVALSIGCRADFNLDDSVDVMDYLDFVSAFATSDPDADFNADRVIDFFDYLDFVNQFATGC
jgi:hypothetical protein